MTFQLRIRKEPDIKGTAENIPGRNNSKSDGNRLGFSEKQPGGQCGWKVVSEGWEGREQGLDFVPTEEEHLGGSDKKKGASWP